MWCWDLLPFRLETMGISSSCRKSNVVWYAPGKPGPSRRTESPFPSQYPVNAVVHVIIFASALPSPFSFQGRERLFLLLVDSIFRGSPWYASFHTPLLISVIEIVSAKGICVDSGLELDPENGPPGSESRRNKRWPWTFALSCLSLVFCALSAIKIPSHHPPLLSPLSPPPGIREPKKQFEMSPREAAGPNSIYDFAEIFSVRARLENRIPVSGPPISLSLPVFGYGLEENQLNRGTQLRRETCLRELKQRDPRRWSYLITGIPLMQLEITTTAVSVPPRTQIPPDDSPHGSAESTGLPWQSFARLMGFVMWYRPLRYPSDEVSSW